MKLLTAASVIGAALVFAGSASAATVTAEPGMSFPLTGGLADFEGITSATTSPNSAPAQGPFNSGGASFSGNGILMTGSASGLYAAPLNDTTQYLTVQPNGPTETVTFGGSFSQLSLYWGSIDNYNSIDFYLAGNKVDTVTGPSPANGCQTCTDTNVDVLINNINGGLFDSIVLTSTQNSFELDNLSWGQTPNNAPGPTPLPGTLPLFISALGGMAGVFKWKRKKGQARA